MRYWVTILSLFIFISNSFTQQAPKRFYLDPYNPEYAPNVVLVKFKDEVNFQQSFLKGGKHTTGIASIDQLNLRIEMESMEKVFKGKRKPLPDRFFKDAAGNVYEIPSLDKIYKIKYKATLNAKDVAKMFEEDPNVEYAEPDYYFYIMGWAEDGSNTSSKEKLTKPASTFPDDPLYQSGDQWYIDAVNAPAAWDSTTGDTTQIIGIIDTGVDWHHPDLDDNIWINKAELNGIPGVDDDGNGFVDDIRGWDFVNNDNDPMDDNSHGTHVAGIAAAEGNNGVGIAGIAWNARIMPVKVLQSSGRGNASDLAAGIDYAAQNGATVINMSLGSYAESQTVKIALENAYAYTVLVAAAGNDELYLLQEGIPSGNMYPACYSFVLGVQASNRREQRATFSNVDPSGPVEFWNQWGYNYEMMAPGVSIISTVPNSGYKTYNGTSMATPIVSGAVALMKSYNSSQSTEQIFARLIQSSTNGILDIANSLDYPLVPNLHYVKYTLVDTLAGDDGDSVPDAGETIELYFTVKNAGGFADSVWAQVEFSKFEDTTVAKLIKNETFLGSIDTYGELFNKNNPIIIKINPDIINNRNIVFNVKFWATNVIDTVRDNIIITVENGEELSGVMDSLLILGPEKKWLVSESFRIGSNGILKIKPGTEIIIYPGKTINVRGRVEAIGKKDSLIIFRPRNNYEAKSAFYFEDGSKGAIFKFCAFSHFKGFAGIDKIIYFRGSETSNFNFLINYSIFWDNPGTEVEIFYPTKITKNVFFNTGLHIAFSDTFAFNNIWGLANGRIDVTNYCNAMFNNFVDISGKILVLNWNDDGNAFVSLDRNAFWIYSRDDIINIPNQYWGTMRIDLINRMIYDFWDNPELAQVNIFPLANKPPSENPAIVWKVLVNGVDPQDEYLDPIGPGIVRFDVYFNHAMDTIYTPLLTFGVREPYTQHVVKDSAHWSPDSTIWTAYYTIGLETGDGINTIRVANARDPEGFEIPIEDSRFQFVIQAAGAAATEFIATPGIGKVDLAWPVANTPDVLGYNMYRFQKLTDSTYTDTMMINSQLILDSTYTDFDVIPDTTYYYLYTVVGTDMKESDFSKAVAATPFNASPGDANGDLTVNVLDITTIVSYLLNQNPQPFIFDAADVNNDGQVNVLDIVAVVNLVMGSGQTQKIAASQNSNRKMIFSTNSVRLENAGEMSALQLVAVGKNLSRDDIQPGNLLKRMEYAFHIKNDTLYLVVYNLKNFGFSLDSGDLFTIKKGEIQKVTSVQAANGNGQFLDVEITGAEELIPKEYALFQNYPNPFNPTTTIRYALPERQDVKIEIYNILGQKVRTFEIKNQPAGFHQVLWDGRNRNNHMVASGLYIYRIKAGDFVASKKMLLIR